MSKTALLGLSAALLLHTGLAQASTYQFDAGLSNYKWQDNGYNENEIEIDGTYYFTPVSSEGVPLAEAGFMGRHSNINGYVYRSTDSDYSGYGVTGELWADELYASVTNYANDGNAVNEFALGYSPKPGVLFSARHAENRCCDQTSYTLGAKYVGTLLGDHSVGVNTEYERREGDDFVNVDFNYYVTPAFSLLLSGGTNNSATQDDLFGIGSRYFFTQRLNAEVFFNKVGNEKLTLVRLGMRF